MGFRTPAPMRNRDRLRKVAGGIKTMGHQKMSYWLGMARHRKHPYRVILMMLHILLTLVQTRQIVL